jgi:hypothetical protein
MRKPQEGASVSGDKSWEDKMSYDEAETVIAEIRKLVKAERYHAAAILCDHLKLMLQARRAMEHERLR